MLMAERKDVKSKNLYKLLLTFLKVIPMLISICYLANSIVSYFGYTFEIFSMIGGMSILPLLFLFLSAEVFRFCLYHKMFLYYILSADIINYVDYFIGIDVSDFNYLIIHAILAGIFLFIILYLYKLKR